MNKESILEYLHFGYVPVEKNRYPFDISAVTKVEQPDNTEQLISKLHELFIQIVRTYDISKPMVVPLSGGTDSRLILAALYREFGPENITAVTFGVPGSMDVKLAKKVADRFSIRHLFINLEEAELSEEKLVNFAGENQGPPTLLLDAFYNHLIRETFGKDVVYYSGFIGDRIAGSVPEHLKKLDDFGVAKRIFIRNNRYDKTGFLPVLQPADFQVQDDENDFLPYYEKLDYRIRQMNMTVPVVLDEGYDMRTPLIDPAWISFFYSLPGKYRNKQNLFFEMAATSYPDFFRIGVKNYFGAPVHSTGFRKSISRKISYGRRILHRKVLELPFADPLINYTDPYWFYIKNRKMAGMVEKNISDLASRAILKDINPGDALEKLQQGRMEYEHAVSVLFNLEIYLKAGFFT